MNVIELDNYFSWDRCPLCISPVIHNVGEIKYRQPVMFSTHYVSLKCSPYLGKCSKCGTWFTQNVVSESRAIELYSKGGSDKKWPRANTFVESKSENIVSRLLQYFVPTKRVLDVGCNTGVLLDFAKSLGCITFGVEPSHSSQEVLNLKGHQFFSSLDTVADKFDVVTAFDLVEHLYDLNRFLKNIYDVLNPGGILIILTGDVSSLSARLSNNNWWYLKAPEHILFPSADFFISLENFDVVSVDKTYASKGYKKPTVYSLIQYIRKAFFKGGYDGLSSLGPDHMLIVLTKI